MNRNYIIILFLVFFLINVEKSHGCYPSGRHIKDLIVNVTDATFSRGEIHITTWVKGGTTDALGHFTFDYNGVSVRILKDPQFVNDHHCENTGSGTVNPVTTTWYYDPSLTPPKGTPVNIYIAIYATCNEKVVSPIFSAIRCLSNNVSYQTSA
ncbi:9562_t:CDS:2 [Funneliformis geosporum]|uniref:9562_t:CDS:1 n=1 Tax=Funneliformis geosporum TaxID=1117311 RepID=A0A9W4SFV9_9GLOM|nr:9562_t:CDS:2 [Funneliformis geosporum]